MHVGTTLQKAVSEAGLLKRGPSRLRRAASPHASAAPKDYSSSRRVRSEHSRITLRASPKSQRGCARSSAIILEPRDTGWPGTARFSHTHRPADEEVAPVHGSHGSYARLELHTSPPTCHLARRQASHRAAHHRSTQGPTPKDHRVPSRRTQPKLRHLAVP